MRRRKRKPIPIPPPEPAPIPPPPPVVTSSLRDKVGINLGHTLRNLTVADLDWIAGMGFGWVRGDAPISDTLMTSLRARGLRVVLVHPQYSSAISLVDETAQTFPDAAIEVGNEPNIPGGNGTWWRDPATYRDLLYRSVDAIRAVNPTATILAAGLSPYGSPGQKDATHWNPVDYYNAVAPLPAGVYANLHPYPGPVSALSTDSWNTYYQARFFPTGTWATEYGYQVGTGGSQGITEAQRTLWLPEGVKAWALNPERGPIFIHSMTDIGGGFGIRGKPVEAVLRNLLTMQAVTV